MKKQHLHLDMADSHRSSLQPLLRYCATFARWGPISGTVAVFLDNIVRQGPLVSASIDPMALQVVVLHFSLPASILPQWRFIFCLQLPQLPLYHFNNNSYNTPALNINFVYDGDRDRDSILASCRLRDEVAWLESPRILVTEATSKKMDI